MIQYVIGDVTQPQGALAKIIVHVCNDIGAWGAGVSGAIGRRWPDTEGAYRLWYANRHLDSARHGMVPFERGRVIFVPVSPDGPIWVANLIGQRGLRSSKNKRPVDYDAIRRGLQAVRERCEPGSGKVTVHMPRIGCGFAGGKWGEIEPIVRQELSEHGVMVFVYDFFLHDTE